MFDAFGSVGISLASASMVFIAADSARQNSGMLIG